LQGWRLTSLGQGDAGVARMQAGLAALRAMGAEILRPYLLALLAEAYGSGGQIEAGLGALKEALLAAAQHMERFYAAELHRLQGELLLRQGAGVGGTLAPSDIRQAPAAGRGATGQAPLPLEAAAAFQTALDMARRQEAKSLELRAALSRSRLWQQQGKQDEARQLLALLTELT
jgi:predicted ATPase